MTARLALGIGLTLAACGSRGPTTEDRAREAFVKDLCEREGNADLWRLMSRGDVVFEEGWSRPLLVDVAPDQPWRQVSATIATRRGVAVRWIGERNHLRLRGDRDMLLRVWGHVDVARIFTRPRVTLAVAGHEVASRVVDAGGDFTVTTVVPADWLDGWIDAYLRLSSVSEPGRDPTALRAARVEGVTWDRAP
jgi:hypothetical protein